MKRDMRLGLSRSVCRYSVEKRSVESVSIDSVLGFDALGA